jgi:antitoxin component YwqK of YwqJK toxin-antitoxin module
MTGQINLRDSEGRCHGLWENYYTGGTLRRREHYYQGKFHGICEHYRSDGTLSWRYRYLHGTPHGLSENYSEGIPYIKRYFLNIK